MAKIEQRKKWPTAIKKVRGLRECPWNPRAISEEDLMRLVASIERFGLVEPLVWSKRNKWLLGGNQRLKALRRLGYTEVQVTIVDMGDVEEMALNVTLNNLHAQGIWTRELGPILERVEDALPELYTEVGLAALEGDMPDLPPLDEGGGIGSLAERFLVPPFSVLDARQGYWQDRKRAWLEVGIRGHEGRPERLAYPLGDSLRPFDAVPEVAGTSVFDPVLAELVYRWFCPAGGTCLDPFAGGSVRGIVAGCLGIKYTGIDLSAEQVAANQAQAKEVAAARKGGGKEAPT